MSFDPRRKILTNAEVDGWIAAERELGRRIGFTCGSFDVLHSGHAQYLALARERCDRLVVAVNTDASVQRYKNPLRPVNPEDQRMYLLAAMSAVDAVTGMDDDRPLRLLQRWKPDLYLKGGDYGAGSLKSAAAVREYGGSVEVIASDFATSTSKAMDRIVALHLHAVPDPSPATGARGLVLLDRDGTLIRDVPFLGDPTGVELLPGAGEGLALLGAQGFRLAIVSNQQGIALGYLTVQDFIAVNQQLFRELRPYGAVISKIYFCPHSAADGCHCRKPGTGMLERAMRDFGMPSGQTFLIGDTGGDVEAATAAGCRSVYVGDNPATGASFTATRFDDAAKWIVGQDAAP